MIFLGTTDKIHEYYQAMDVFLLPSKFEGLPVVGIEVQANGLPCLFSKNITEELKINENVSFLDIDNIEAWKDCILKIKKDEMNRIQVIKNIEENYNILNESKKIEQIYGEMNGG